MNFISLVISFSSVLIAPLYAMNGPPQSMPLIALEPPDDNDADESGEAKPPLALSATMKMIATDCKQERNAIRYNMIRWHGKRRRPSQYAFEPDNFSSFFQAVRSGSSDLVKQYANHHKQAGTLDQVYSFSTTPLMAAISARRIAAAFILLECGADPNLPSHRDDLKTPIEAALQIHDPKIRAVMILHLLDHGARPDPQEDVIIHRLISDQRAIIEARNHKKPRPLRQGRALPAAAPNLFYALIHCSFKVIEEVAQLWQSKINTEYSRRGLTALHCAITSRSLLKVKLILSLGADIDGPNTNGTSPLQYAMDLGGRKDIINYLQEQGASAFKNVFDIIPAAIPIEEQLAHEQQKIDLGYYATPDEKGQPDPCSCGYASLCICGYLL